MESSPALNQFIANIFIAAFLGWGLGYLLQKLASPKLRVMIAVPRWLMVLCGSARRDGLLSPRAIFMQIMGVLLAAASIAVLLMDAEVPARSAVTGSLVLLMFSGVFALSRLERLASRYGYHLFAFSQDPGPSERSGRGGGPAGDQEDRRRGR